MGKACRVKEELMDVRNLLDLIQVLKDVADNKYFALVAQKNRITRFAESFVDFFQVVSLTNVEHKLVVNDNPRVGIVSITSEDGFLGDLNGKVVARAAQLKEQFDDSFLVTVGRKGEDKLNSLGVKSDKIFEDIADLDSYEFSMMLKTYLIDEVMEGRLGKILLIYPWAKDFTTIKGRVIKLLPCNDLLQKQSEYAGEKQKVFQESDSMDVVGYLANTWVANRLYEVMFEMTIAAAAAQSAQLESSLDNIKKEDKQMLMKYRKARKLDIDTSLREVFSARLMSQ